MMEGRREGCNMGLAVWNWHFPWQRVPWAACVSCVCHQSRSCHGRGVDQSVLLASQHLPNTNDFCPLSKEGQIPYCRQDKAWKEAIVCCSVQPRSVSMPGCRRVLRATPHAPSLALPVTEPGGLSGKFSHVLQAVL